MTQLDIVPPGKEAAGEPKHGLEGREETDEAVVVESAEEPPAQVETVLTLSGHVLIFVSSLLGLLIMVQYHDHRSQSLPSRQNGARALSKNESRTSFLLFGCTDCGSTGHRSCSVGQLQHRRCLRSTGPASSSTPHEPDHTSHCTPHCTSAPCDGSCPRRWELQQCRLKTCCPERHCAEMCRASGYPNVGSTIRYNFTLETALQTSESVVPAERTLPETLPEDLLRF